MIKIQNKEVSGWEAAVRGMRNSYASWNKSDSWCGCYNKEGKKMEIAYCLADCHTSCEFCVGDSDLALMKKLTAGSSHRKFIRFITVTFDITAPLYFWKQFDTYKVGVNCLSTSTMHSITNKEFTLDDFSHEHLTENGKSNINWTLKRLNAFRKLWLLFDVVEEVKDADILKEFPDKNVVWWQIIQLLPSSYNQLRTIQLNYEVLAAIYKDRKNHRLDEWHDFCAFIESLPYSELITGGANEL